ncbi:MAG: PEP-CTERM sorting domain-containing protein [Lentisphaeria bacterium]
MSKTTKLTTGLLGLLVGALAASAGAAVTMEYKSDTYNAYTNRDVILNTDLANQGQATVASYSANADGGGFDNTEGGSDGAAAFCDGGAGGAYNTRGDAWGTSADVYFNLDSGTGGCAQGYNISQVRIFSGWPDDRGGTRFSVDYSVVGSADWVTLYSYSPSTRGTGQTLGNEFIIYNSVGGVNLISNCDAIRINMTPVANSDYSLWLGTVYQEIDVLGTPVPEPASLGLLLLGGLALLRRRR